MVKRGDASVVLWPRYFDARLSRAEGRRVSRGLAVKDPEVDAIAAAAKASGLASTVEAEAHDPRVPYKAVGRVLVPKHGSKEAVIKAVAQAMAAGQGARANR